MEDFVPNIVLPEKPLFILSIDTEEEWDWTSNFPQPPFSTRNIEQIPHFQRFCEDLQLKPSYFVDYAVADSPVHAEILRGYFDADECDIGAHLHPWANPPIEEDINEFNSHAVNLKTNLFENKIIKLTNKLINTFGRHPYSYRAGRWAVNHSHLNVLGRLGYRVDSSNHPFYPDKHSTFSKTPTGAHWPSRLKGVLERDLVAADILEIPITGGYNHPNFELMHKIYSTLSKSPLNRLRLIGILWQLGILRQTTVTPEGTKYKDVCRCIDASIKRGDMVINMFIHSSDLLPGNTQYVRNNADKKRFLDHISYTVEHLRNKHDCEMTTMREIRRRLTGAP